MVWDLGLRWLQSEHTQCIATIITEPALQAIILCSQTPIWLSWIQKASKCTKFRADSRHSKRLHPQCDCHQEPNNPPSAYSKSPEIPDFTCLIEVRNFCQFAGVTKSINLVGRHPKWAQLIVFISLGIMIESMRPHLSPSLQHFS